MGGIHRPADKEVNIRSFFKQQPADAAGTVLIEAPLLVKRITSESVPRILQYLVDGDHAFRDQIHPFNFGNGGHIAALKVQAGPQGLSQISGGNGGGGAATDNVFALLAEDQ